MATINGVTSAIQHSVVQTQWIGFTTTGDVGTPEQLSRWTYHSVEFISNGATGTILLEGSDVPNPGANDWKTLTGSNSAGGFQDISATATARFDFVNVPRHIRARASAMSAGTFDVYLTSRSLGH